MASTLEIRLINGKIVKNVPIEVLKLIDNPAKDPDRGLLSKIKLTLTEMYMNEYYEGLTNNFVTSVFQEGEHRQNLLPYPFLFIFYNQKPKVGRPAEIIDKKLLEAVLGGSQVQINSS